jgi:hypothetical protein
VRVHLGGDDRRILDTEYEARRYFSLDDPWLHVPRVSQSEVVVFVTSAQPDADRRLGLDVRELTGTVTGGSDGEPVADLALRLEAVDDFVLLQSESEWGSLLILGDPLPDDRRLFVGYVDRPEGAAPLEVGNYFSLGTESSLHLRLLAPALDDVESGDLTAEELRRLRRFERRNIYDLGTRDIDPSTLEIRIGLIGDSDPYPHIGPDPILRALGLDLIDNDSGTGCTPDFRVDPLWIDRANGFLIFPDTQPFAPGFDDLVDAGGVRRDDCRRSAPGWRQGGVPVTFVPAAPADAASETNPALYDTFLPTPGQARYEITGYFEREE